MMISLFLSFALCLSGVWGGKGQGKSFQTELIFQAMGMEPVIMSAGELESERAGETLGCLMGIGFRKIEKHDESYAHY